MTLTQILFPSIPRIETENLESRIVYFWQKVNEDLQIEKENI